MAIYLNGQLVAGSNDGLKSATTVEQAETVTNATTVNEATTINHATTIKEYNGGIENINNIGSSGGTLPDDMDDIANKNCIYYEWANESDLNLYIYQPTAKKWKTFKLGGAY